MEKISGVIFDMDGLILDTEAIYSASNIVMAEKYGLKGYDEAYYKTEIGLSEEHVFKKYLEDYPYLEESVIREFFDESRQVVRETFKETGAPLKKGIVELLTYLKQASIPCIVASSNTKETIEDLLVKAELKEFFVDVVSCNDVTHAKPDPEIVEKAVEKLGTPKNETVMLEDSLNGIRASYAAGVSVIMVPDLLAPTDEALEKAHSIKKDLLEVLAFISEK
ncbi:HAD family hydrolase [Vagococcus hydrophili]|uniref:HAD family hydrolase n=1 Tax=Vagococcus hydrophili TaxID=2714947 RepID=A0A6G8AQX3_9ENTE|nr:HAD family hydrolase [Vagococcus hydrophili]QIL47464.1 HAD family hydrolase [Vagococcus hydrophili]